MPTNFPHFLDQAAVTVAPLLLGCVLERQFGDQTARVRIVETEAYDQADAASHSFSGNTARTAIMFGPSGYLYVYFTYGMHYCCNVVTGPEGRGEAVLIRAVEPLDGEASLLEHRAKPGLELTNGPAKLCRALQIDRQMNGHDLRQLPLRLIRGETLGPDQIIIRTRIGIAKAQDELRRFYIGENPYVSRP